MLLLNYTFLQYMITLGKEGSIAETVVDMLLAQDATSEEKPLVIKIEEECDRKNQLQGYPCEFVFIYK